MGSTSIQFGQPKHGWLDVSLQSPDGRNQFLASHTPDDSLTQLANAGLAVSVGHPGTVRWSLEPEYEFWTIGVSASGATLITSEFSITGQPIEIAAIIMRGLADLESRWPEGSSSEHWCHEFPSRELQDLKAKVRLFRSIT